MILVLQGGILQREKKWKNHTPKVSQIRKSATFLSKNAIVKRFLDNPEIWTASFRWVGIRLGTPILPTDLYAKNHRRCPENSEFIWLHTGKSRSVVVQSWSLRWGFPILWGRCMIRLFSLGIFIISMIALDLTIGAHMKSFSKKKMVPFQEPAIIL